MNVQAQPQRGMKITRMDPGSIPGRSTIPTQPMGLNWVASVQNTCSPHSGKIRPSISSNTTNATKTGISTRNYGKAKVYTLAEPAGTATFGYSLAA